MIGLHHLARRRRRTSPTLETELRADRRVGQVARFGQVLHVSGTDAAALEAVAEEHQARGMQRWQKTQAGLEEAFIYLMAGATDNFARGCGMTFSLSRFLAVLIKEFVQMRRDRVTFAMMVGIPIMQLLLFGYAINSDPRHLPTLVEMNDSGPVTRALLAAMETSTYFDFQGRRHRPRGRRPGAPRRHGQLRRRHPAGLRTRRGARARARNPGRRRCLRPDRVRRRGGGAVRHRRTPRSGRC